MKPSVVVLLFTHKPGLQPHEESSLRQCYNVLGSHAIRLVCPSNLDVSSYRRTIPALQVDPIPAKWFSSIRQYNLLKSLPWLYHRYRQYNFMLTYELDAWVFRDEVAEWCERGWDYIGAPWFEGFYDCDETSPVLGVGNSGFSLRNIQAATRVFQQLRRDRIWRIVNSVMTCRRSAMRDVASMRSASCFYRPLEQALPAPLPSRTYNEDLFWGVFVPRVVPEFRVAPYEVARYFSFEANARRLYAETGRLPFGCHKWNMLNHAFWRDHIPVQLGHG
jgi:hypothetical protein